MALTKVQILKVAKKKKVTKLKERLQAHQKLEKILLKQIAKLTEQDNAKFKKLTPERARVVLAQDVIKQLKDKKITATMGRYIDIRGNDADVSELVERAEETARKDLVTIKLPPCNVCAIGSVFVAAFNRFDEMPLDDFKDVFSEGRVDTDDALIGYLEQWFEPEQLRLMEAAFEPGEAVYNLGKVSSTDVDRAQEFRRQVKEKRSIAAELSTSGYQDTLADALLVAIMKNIIKHKGTFNP